MIKLVKSTFYNEGETKRRLIEFLSDAEHLTFGPECERFEAGLARYQGRDHCVFVNSGSSANLAIVQALLNLGLISAGDLVGFSALTWSTNVMPLLQLGLEAIPVDIELTTLNVSPQKLDQTLERFPLRALFITNLLGLCDDIDGVRERCAADGVILIEDTCEALGSEYGGTKLGNFGLASTFSFYVGHQMSTIEGGAVCTDDEQLASMLRMVRAHGWDRNLTLAHQTRLREDYRVASSFYSRYTFYESGYNLRPTDIAGFLGNVQLGYIDEILSARNRNFLRLTPAIYEAQDRFRPVHSAHMSFLSSFAMPVVCRSLELRDELVARCEGRVETRPLVGGDITQQPFFRTRMPRFADVLGASNAALAHERGFYLPNNPELTDADIDEMLDLLLS